MFKESKAKSLYKYHSLSGYISALGLPINSENKVNERATKNECSFCDNEYNTIKWKGIIKDRH